MRIIFALSLLSVILFSCGPSTTNQETEETTDSTSVALNEPSVPLKKTLWNIPLTEFWKDEAHFILTVPDEVGVTIMYNASRSKIDYLVNDTLQGKFRERVVDPLYSTGCEPFQSLQVELGTEPTRGWVMAEEVYTIRQLDIATFTHGDATFKVGLMEPWYKQDDGDACYYIHLIFLYDDQYLYLIDAEGTDFELHWEDAKHLSVVNMIGNMGFEGSQQGNSWILTWGEPNVKKELRLAWTGDHVKYQSYNVIPQNDVDDLNPDEGVEVDEVVGEMKTVTCVLQDAALGDCFYLGFDCGDFGSAKVELTEAEMELWQDLYIDNNGETVVNPKYVGKKFEITYQIIIGEGCGDPSVDHSREEIQRVTKFKLK